MSASRKNGWQEAEKAERKRNKKDRKRTIKSPLSTMLEYILSFSHSTRNLTFYFCGLIRGYNDINIELTFKLVRKQRDTAAAIFISVFQNIHRFFRLIFSAVFLLFYCSHCLILTRFARSLSTQATFSRLGCLLIDERSSSRLFTLSAAV